MLVLQKAEQIDQLQIGDEVQTPGPFQGLSSEPVIWKVTEVKETGLRVLHGTYHGVSFGSMALKNQKGKIVCLGESSWSA